KLALCFRITRVFVGVELHGKFTIGRFQNFIVSCFGNTKDFVRVDLHEFVFQAALIMTAKNFNDLTARNTYGSWLRYQIESKMLSRLAVNRSVPKDQTSDRLTKVKTPGTAANVL